MSCENPKRIRNPKYKMLSKSDKDHSKILFTYDLRESLGKSFGDVDDRYIEVPCGKCSSCVRSRLNGFKMRLYSECAHAKSVTFVTLTFDNYHLHKFRNDPNKSVTQFLDRCRKKFGRSLRHWFTAEYGDEKGRLHYHGLIFDYPPEFNEDSLENLWTLGRSHFGYVNEKTIPYLLKYATKGSKNGKKPPRLVSSPGIGKDFIKDYDYLVALGQTAIPVNNYFLPLPRYVKDKMFDDFQRIILTEIANVSPFKRCVDGRFYYTKDSYKKALKAYSAKQKSIGLTDIPKTSSALKDYYKNISLNDLQQNFDSNID